MKKLKLSLAVLLIVSLLSGCVLFSNSSGSKDNTSKKESPVSGGKK